MRELAEPQKELRFTRSGQAVPLLLLAAVFATAAIILLACASYRSENPELPSPLWAVLPLVLSGSLIWLAQHLTRYAYIILTPLGLEIFPFYKPAQGMQLIPWADIDTAEIDRSYKLLTLHFSPQKTSGMHITLRPVKAGIRPFLAKAVIARSRASV